MKIKLNSLVSESEMPWGREEILVVSSKKYMMKKLLIKAGQKGGLQFHRFKDECGYVVKGKMIIRTPNESGALEEFVVSTGDWFHFPAGAIHQEEAIEDTIIVEAGLPIKNDRIRVEERFGLAEAGFGLETTDESDIEWL